VPAAEAGEPISPPEAAALLDPLKGFGHVALAVSGGSDSVALMWLAAHWANQTEGAPKLTVLSVDHRLRPQSRAEAKAVARRAKALGLAAAVLEWRGAKPATGLQEKAREARYELLARWCASHGARALVTAHTLDDQAETFLMRLARGSGVDGLAGIRPRREEPLPILRPLLGIARARLRATLEAAGETWVDDPSNVDPRFERVRWRKVLEVLGREGISRSMIALSAGRIERASRALEAATSRLEEEAVRHQAESAALDAGRLEKAPEELVIRLLQRLIARYGGAQEPPPLAAVERLAAWLVEGQGRGRTLGGCRIARRAGEVRLGPEPPRRTG
jgi:tRNA(Ile)-lysidine synthase